MTDIRELAKIKDELESMFKDGKWHLVSPEGKIYSGSVEQIISVLLPNNKFIQMNTPFGV